MNGAQYLCEALLASDVDVCFANPGTSEMHFVAALDAQPRMRCILGLFEGVVTGAADGYARMAGKPAATLLHLGSGLGNGVANLHNARRARSPVVNIVGDHARHHLAFDAPLTSDIQSIAGAVSQHVQTAGAPERLRDDVSRAIGAALQQPGQVSTLVLPADIAWSEVPAGLAVPRILPRRTRCVADSAVDDAARALRQGGAMLLLGGKALRGAALRGAAAIAAATGADLLAEASNARMERGREAPALPKLPYVVDAALERLRGVRRLILVGAQEPVAFFAYPGKPSRLLPEGCEVLTLAAPGDDLPEALERLGRLLESTEPMDDANAPAAAALPPPAAPELPADDTAPLEARALCQAIAALLPAGAIVTDESVTQGRSFFEQSFGAAPHDYLQLTGGAIGIGLPLAVGAAVACPGRQVVSLQADGSAMYTFQALWTQARERLKCLTVVFSNRRYAILHQEMQNVGVAQPGRNATSMLSIGDPDIDWTALAAGLGVPALRAVNLQEFVAAFRTGLATPGPCLIEAVLP